MVFRCDGLLRSCYAGRYKMIRLIFIMFYSKSPNCLTVCFARHSTRDMPGIPWSLLNLFVRVFDGTLLPVDSRK